MIGPVQNKWLNLWLFLFKAIIPKGIGTSVYNLTQGIYTKRRHSSLLYIYWRCIPKLYRNFLCLCQRRQTNIKELSVGYLPRSLSKTAIVISIYWDANQTFGITVLYLCLLSVATSKNASSNKLSLIFYCIWRCFLVLAH